MTTHRERWAIIGAGLLLSLLTMVASAYMYFRSASFPASQDWMAEIEQLRERRVAENDAHHRRLVTLAADAMERNVRFAERLMRTNRGWAKLSAILATCNFVLFAVLLRGPGSAGARRAD